MSVKDEITKAIGAHVLWKSRLKTAIATGKSDFTYDKVKVDNQCDFGKFLYGNTPSDPNQKKCHDTCRQLHAEFHKHTAEILKMALEGKKADAEKKLDAHSQYTELSTKLTAEMMNWSKIAN